MSKKDKNSIDPSRLDDKNEARAAKRAKKADRRSAYRRNYRGKQRSTSIYFLVWAIFSALLLVVVLLFGVTQHALMVQTYKKEAQDEITQKGKKIEAAIMHELPDAFGENMSGYVRFLSATYDVKVFILNGEGEVLFPQESNFDPDNPTIQEHFDFSEEMKRMLKQMEESGEKAVVYDGGEEYVYGSKLSVAGSADVYLYTAKSMQLVMATVSKMGVRTVLLAVFAFVLTFAVSSAVAGWMIKPIAEITDKARLLAHGDFNVDFHGVDYGKEMVELADALNFARDELSKTDRMQKELIANVSHDFKTPLTMIKAYAAMIQEISGDVPEKRNKHAQVIVDEADRLTSLVNDVLDLSKIRSGIETLKDDLLDMSSYTERVLDRFAYLKETQGYRFETDIEKGLYTRADELKIGQVLYNLIGNAVNYTGEDKSVLIRLKKYSDTAFYFAVTDTGSGIKPEEMDAVWDRYYRSSEMHKRPIKGMGLGLSIVKTILEKHAFRFGIDSRVGKGSTFYVVFPLVEIVEEIDDTDEE
ncbi:MAG: HAMP domain-containing histidine kinase [Clostridia bacterium]|nr:HAMP domain-containing histidine kinase [Clostridia bacterium]